jgi:hypothetical protein
VRGSEWEKWKASIFHIFLLSKLCGAAGRERGRVTGAATVHDMEGLLPSLGWRNFLCDWLKLGELIFDVALLCDDRRVISSVAARRPNPPTLELHNHPVN